MGYTCERCKIVKSFRSEDPSECAWAKPPKAEQRGQKSPEDSTAEQEPPLDALAKTKMPCCNCARRSAPWSRAEYYERACNQCLQRNQKFKIKQASQQNTAFNSSEKGLFPLWQQDGIARTNSMSPPLGAMSHHAALPGHPLSPLNGAPLHGSGAQTLLSPTTRPPHFVNGGDGAHVSFADMSLSSGDNHLASNGSLDEPPPRYDLREDPKAFTHEHLYYEERGRRFALEGQLKFMQTQLAETSKERIELERAKILQEIELSQVRHENEELRRRLLELPREISVSGPADSGSDI